MLIIFLPGLIWKLIHRGGWKKTFSERFGIYSAQRKAELMQFRSAVWIHAVSVGETVVALSFINAYHKHAPEKRFILSTGTTTGQALAREKAPEYCRVIFCPLDCYFTVRHVLNLLKPAELLIFETELWPNLIYQAHRCKIKLALLNGRLSDHSINGYYRFRCFFRPLLAQFDLIAAQSQGDAERFKTISPQAGIHTTGNLKFDQKVDPKLPAVDYSEYFADHDALVLTGASTHNPEEELIAKTFLKLKAEFPHLKLVLVPRHAERGSEIASMLKQNNISFSRRSQELRANNPVDCLLADTTGEMMKLLKGSDIVIMGKSLAGQSGGHNLLEPALLGKAIVCGKELTNFRFIMDALKNKQALLVAETDNNLYDQLKKIISDPALRQQLGKNALAAAGEHSGAADKILTLLDKIKK